MHLKYPVYNGFWGRGKGIIDLATEHTENTEKIKKMEDTLTEKIIGAAIEVHRILGPGLLEAIYEEALC